MATFSNGESGLSVRTKINAVLQHADGTAGEIVFNDAGADVDFRVESDTNANALFVDGATGNVGIGTAAPIRQLTLNSNQGGMRLSHFFATSDFSEVSFGTDGIAGSGAAIRSYRANDAFSGNEGDLRFYTNFGTVTSTDDATERMRIDGSGNLLIGTTTSGASKLRISGLPTSSAGLSAGDVWNDAGTLKIA